ncbi:hypothetical protein [Cupriavidus sp. a3]|uniref:hypothetical protein n=1 Tax=Cupriavidus sp. a3 TaxID=3242158 RepID=UPI003D9C2408
MTPHKQLISHDPEHGFYGDCWRTCIACLLDLHPSQVPNFVEGVDQPAAEKAARAWLKARGYNLIKLCMLADYPDAAAEWFDDMPYILVGQSPNIPGIGHCVIGRGAFEMLWDPALSGLGLAGPWQDENGNRVYWIEFIVPLQLPELKESA